MEDKIYFCIDMKCFFASVECAERGLNPFETNLVVADESRGQGAICLA
ncbi:MAG TPA: DNA repair protein, partial [Clostridiales bacterium]|nr:DNA repair protein [Clostridiales bacterium]